MLRLLTTRNYLGLDNSCLRLSDFSFGVTVTESGAPT